MICSYYGGVKAPKFIAGLILLFIGLPSSSKADTVWAEQQYLFASDESVDDGFGCSVSIDGDTALVGAMFSQQEGIYSGAVYVFVREGASWTEQQKLVPSDGAEWDFFGKSVSVSGDIVMIGADRDDDQGDDSGSVYVFQRTGDTWVENQKLAASNGSPSGSFGASVSVSGDTALVGSINDPDNEYNMGSVYVFVRSGTTWAEQQRLVPGDPESVHIFGASVALSDDTALVGAPVAHENLGEPGGAFVFIREGESWSEQQQLNPSNSGPEDNFGWSVAIDGDIAVVGEVNDSFDIDENGSVYVFKRTDDSWDVHQRLLPDQGTFGAAVSVDDGSVIAGEPRDYSNEADLPGSAVVFVEEPSPATGICSIWSAGAHRPGSGIFSILSLFW